MTTAPRRVIRALGLTLLMLVLAAGPVVAQTGALSVNVRDSDLSEDGTTRLVVSVTGDAAEGTVLSSEAFGVTEDGEPVDSLAVEPLLESDPAQVGVMIAIDVSGSTQGAPLAAARNAASAFATSLTEQGVRVGVVAFGDRARIVTPLTDDAGAVAEAIEGLRAAGETSLYDAVVLAAERLGGVEGSRQLVVFSDGADTVSEAGLVDAVEAATVSETPVTTVALRTPALDEASLRQLAQRTEGSFISVGDVDSLAGAFDAAAEQIASQYVLTYQAADEGPDELTLEITVSAAGARATDALTVTNPRRITGEPLPAVEIPEPGVLSGEVALWIGLAGAFLAVALLLGIGGVAVSSEAKSRRLQRRLESYARGGRSQDRTKEMAPSEIGRRAAELIDRIPKPTRFEGWLQERLDRAAWPLRASEFLAIVVGAALAVGLVSWALSGSLLLPVPAMAMGGAVPFLVLDNKITRRTDAFMDQLPDTLSMLSSSLRAGYGLVQAINTVVREAPDPTAEEFSRALTETRLGMPVDEALTGIAERIGSEDFAWVVIAVNIQAEVGGNLSELLDTVAATLRERAQVRRQVRTLSAEGRLSAAILVALPFLVGFWIFLQNPDYLSLLWTTTVGIFMSAFAAVMMVIGIVWIRRVIEIEV